jgi:uncharacterized protein YkwD
MRGFIFRICGAILCLTVLLCACQKDGDEVTTTSTVPVTTTAAATTQAPTTTTTAPATTTTTKASTTAAPKKKNNSKTTTTTKAASKKPAAQTPAQNQTVSGAQTGFESDMLKQVNAQRAKNGKSALTLNQSLCASARVRASEIAKDGCFSHTRPDDSGCFTAISGVSYRTAGENIAMGTWGYYGVDEIMDGWMNSEGHRANILNGDFSEVGFGCVVVNGNGYWVQMFIG